MYNNEFVVIILYYYIIVILSESYFLMDLKGIIFCNIYTMRKMIDRKYKIEYRYHCNFNHFNHRRIVLYFNSK